MIGCIIYFLDKYTYKTTALACSVKLMCLVRNNILYIICTLLFILLLLFSLEQNKVCLHLDAYLKSHNQRTVRLS